MVEIFWVWSVGAVWPVGEKHATGLRQVWHARDEEFRNLVANIETSDGKTFSAEAGSIYDLKPCGLEKATFASESDAKRWCEETAKRLWTWTELSFNATEFSGTKFDEYRLAKKPPQPPPDWTGWGAVAAPSFRLRVIDEKSPE